METFDTRGSETSIGRLLKFDKLAFVHVFFYRVLIFFSFIAAAIALIYFITLNQTAFLAMQVAIVIVWILFTPQLFATAKVLSISMTNGISFGKLNPSFMSTVEKKKSTVFFNILPYVALVIWVAGFVVLLFTWFR